MTTTTASLCTPHERRPLTEFQIRCALAAGRLLGKRRRLRGTLDESWRLVPTGGIMRAPYLDAGLNLLVVAGLAHVTGDWVYPHSDLGTIANGGVVGQLFTELIEGRLREPALSTETPLDDAALLALGRRFDAEAAATLGRLGELAVAQECRATLVRLGHPERALDVVHVAAISDQLGYDVFSPTIDGRPARLEVKTTALADELTVYLSRAEFRAARTKPGWSLVVCGAVDASTATIIGWCHASLLAPRTPADPTEHGRWETARIELARTELRPGLPLNEKSLRRP
jgi:hypothetical protein